MLVTDLIKLIPSDTKKIVQQTRDRYNTSVRNILRAETRLSFQKAGEGEDRDDSVVSVKVDQIGVPDILKRHSFPPELELAALLAPYQHHLRALRGSASAVHVMRDEVKQAVEDALGNAAEGFGHLEPCAVLAEELLREAEKKDVLSEIFSVNQDILGHYRFEMDEQNDTTGQSIVTLYWGIIGLVASILGVSVEGMTVKVMAHELAHAYTHLGFDIDGQRWRGRDFGESDRGVVEGLAQYYTARAMDKLQSRVPDCRRAYDLVVPKQPADYQVQVPWLKLLSPETMRVCLIRARKQVYSGFDFFEGGAVRLDDFDRQLCEEELKMKGKSDETLDEFMGELNKCREDFAKPRKTEGIV